MVNHCKPWYDRKYGGTVVHHGIVWCYYGGITMVWPRGNTTWLYHGNTMWYTMVQPYHGILRGFTITQKTCYSLLRSVSWSAAIVGLFSRHVAAVFSSWNSTNSNRRKCLTSYLNFHLRTISHFCTASTVSSNVGMQ